MNKTKPARDLWSKAQTIGIIANAIFGAIKVIQPQTQILERSADALAQAYTWSMLLWTAAANILM